MRRIQLSAGALVWVLAVLATLAEGARVAAQDGMPDWQKKAGGAMRFDVTSVKQNKGDNPAFHWSFPIGPGETYGYTGGLFRVTDLPLIIYIDFAYKVTENQEEEIVEQLPHWAQTERFDIEARADGNPTKDQMRLMMQALLKERFGFAMHYESREMRVLALKVSSPGKFGPQLRPHPEDEVCGNELPAQGTGPQASVRAVPANTGIFPRLCGGIIDMRPSILGTAAMGGRNIPIKLFADSIAEAGQLGRPVIDKTGLRGTYDFRLDWTLQNSGPASPGASPSPDSSGPSFIEALKQQMGLKLESERGQVEEIIVDHIDRPTSN